MEQLQQDDFAVVEAFSWPVDGPPFCHSGIRNPALTQTKH